MDLRPLAVRCKVSMQNHSSTAFRHHGITRSQRWNRFWLGPRCRRRHCGRRLGRLLSLLGKVGVATTPGGRLGRIGRSHAVRFLCRDFYQDNGILSGSFQYPRSLVCLHHVLLLWRNCFHDGMFCGIDFSCMTHRVSSSSLT